MLILLAVLALIVAAMVYHFATGQDLRRLPHRKLKPLLCRIRGHKRSGRHIHKIGDSYHSRCKSCGLPMVKDTRLADWRIAARYPAAAHGAPPVVAIEPVAAVPADTTAGPIIRRGEPVEDAA